MKIRVLNTSDRETVTYPLPLLTGDVEGFSQDGRLLVSSSGDPDGVIDWPIVDGCFKVLVRLQPGENIINLRWEHESLTLRLTYRPPGFSHMVKPVYIVCADDDGYFQGPPGTDCSPESAARRIGLGSEVIQTLTAEKMKEQGFFRRSDDDGGDCGGGVTFQLETADDHRAVCNIFRSQLRLQEAYAMNGYELWNYFGKELMTSQLFSQKSRTKFYCFMSFTRYKLPEDALTPKTHSEILKYTQGHTALGGGNLALFGTGNLHTWADHLSTFNRCLTNRTKIDRRTLMDDSAYREYYWANYATGLGASLHELGHTFDLAHTPTGIMARGFDDLHKVFTVQKRRRSRHHHRQHHHQHGHHKHRGHHHQGARDRYSSTGSSASSDRSRSTSSNNSNSSIDIDTDGSASDLAGGGGANPHIFLSASSSLGSSATSTNSSGDNNNYYYYGSSGGGGGGSSSSSNNSGGGTFSHHSINHKTMSSISSGGSSNSSSGGGSSSSSGGGGSSSSSGGGSSSSSSSGSSNPRAIPIRKSHAGCSSPGHQKRKTDVCYGSPYRNNPLTTAANSGHRSVDGKSTPNKSTNDASSSNSITSTSNINNNIRNSNHGNLNLSSSSPLLSQSLSPSPLASVPQQQDDKAVSSQRQLPGQITPTSPLVVSVESGFKTTVAGSSALTFSVKNYDGSETRQTILEGQTVSETTFNPDGRVVNKNSKATDRRPSATSITSAASSSSSVSSTPSTLPNSPEERSPNNVTSSKVTSERPEIKHADSAHWFRSSAVVLRYHKWFNKEEGQDNGKNPTLHGPCIKSHVGLRLVELRTDPEGTVFAHWEFIGNTPPTEFLLYRSEVSSNCNSGATIPPEGSIIIVMAEDTHGFIMKKKFKVDTFL